MKKNKNRVMIIILGCVVSFALTVKYVMIYVEQQVYDTDLGIDILWVPTLFLMQAMVIVFLFYTTDVNIRIIKELKQSGKKLNILDKIGLSLQVLSLIVIIIFKAYFVYLESVCATLLCVGVFQYIKSPTKLTISFLLWGIGLLFLAYIFLRDSSIANQLGFIE